MFHVAVCDFFLCYSLLFLGTFLAMYNPVCDRMPSVCSGFDTPVSELCGVPHVGDAVAHQEWCAGGGASGVQTVSRGCGAHSEHHAGHIVAPIAHFPAASSQWLLNYDGLLRAIHVFDRWVTCPWQQPNCCRPSKTVHLSTNIFSSIRVFSHVIHRDFCLFLLNCFPTDFFTGRSLDTSISIVTKAGRARFRLPAGSRDIFFAKISAEGSRAHPDSYSVGTRGFFPGIKAFGSWPVTPTWCWS